jgi:YidC/Oxa1 family membrane protein insertase
MKLAVIPVLQQLIDAFEWVLVRFHDLGAGWGLSIILLTIVIRAALIPLTLRQFRSMQALQKLQPEMKALQAKYKDDKQRLNQEMMKFYRENKVNPLGSCLPLLLQFPVFISLFYMLRKDLKLNICGHAVTTFVSQHHAQGATLTNTPCEKVAPGSAQFLFIPDLTNRATGAVLIALIVLYVGSQVGSTLLMSVTADKTQRNMMLLLPLVFVAFILQFPAGLIVYWITTNLWTIVQQYIVRRRVGPMRPPPTAASGDDAGGSGLGALLRGRMPQPAAATAGSGEKAKSSSNGARTPAGPPPPSPRKKKKRSGRRR